MLKNHEHNEYQIPVTMNQAQPLVSNVETVFFNTIQLPISMIRIMNLHMQNNYDDFK